MMDEKTGQTECKSQRGRTFEEQGSLNRHEQSSDELTETESARTGPAWSVSGPLRINCDFQSRVLWDS